MSHLIRSCPLTDEDWDLLSAKLPIAYEVLHNLRLGHSLALQQEDFNFLRESAIALEALRSLLELDLATSGIFTEVLALNSRVDFLEDVRKLEKWFETLGERYLQYSRLANSLRNRYDIPLKSYQIDRQYEAIEKVLGERSYGSLKRAAALSIQTFGASWMSGDKDYESNRINHRLRSLIENAYSDVKNPRKAWSDFKGHCESICNGDC
jgi:hypothetical protein